MPRDFDALYKAQQVAVNSTASIETLSLPPGYLSGYDVRLRKDYTVVVSAGTANVGGLRVQKKAEHQIVEEDWVAPKITSTRHYYIYLSKAGEFRVDIIAPKWSDKYIYWEHPDMGWRAVGKVFLYNGNVVFAIKEVEKAQRTVTVAPDGWTGDADYYCTGGDDQILINAAITYLGEAYDGGTVQLLRGTFLVSDRILITTSNITLTSEAKGASVISPTAIFDSPWGMPVPPGRMLVHIVPPTASDKVRVSNIAFSSPTIGRGSEFIAVWVESEATGVEIDSCTVTGNMSGFMVEGERAIVTKCQIIDCLTAACSWACSFGIYVTTNYATITGNIVDGLSSDASAYGIYAEDYALVTDNVVRDVVITSLGSYGIGIEVLLATNGAIVCDNHVRDNYDTGISVSGTSIKVSNNYCRNNGSDTGIANTNGDNFSDTGTDTQVYSNSWQQPVSGEPSEGEGKVTGRDLLVNYTAVTSTASVSVTVGLYAPIGTRSVDLLVYAWPSASGNFNLSVAPSAGYVDDTMLNYSGYGLSAKLSTRVSNNTFRYTPGASGNIYIYLIKYFC